VPDYNIAPSTSQPIIRASPEDGEREIVLMRWGLIPAKVADPGSFKIFSTTNARAETILEKPIWKGRFQHSRCLVPLDGFYEWLQRPSLPQPPPIEPGRAWFVREYCSSNEIRCETEGWLKTGIQVRDAGRRALRTRGIVLRVAAAPR
jgi:putative SOS response-associated peptidase YedK